MVLSEECPCVPNNRELGVFTILSRISRLVASQEEFEFNSGASLMIRGKTSKSDIFTSKGISLGSEGAAPRHTVDSLRQ